MDTTGYIHLVGPNSVDTSSKFHKADQRSDYHSNSVGHDTEDCVNLKYKIQDLMGEEVISLQIATPNVHTNLLPIHGGVNINIIETDNNWCMTNVIVWIFHEEMERVVASLSIKEKKEFVILTPIKVVTLAPIETAARPRFVIKVASTRV